MPPGELYIFEATHILSPKGLCTFFLKLHKMVKTQGLDEKEVINVLKIADSEEWQCKCGLCCLCLANA
jgi:hypothetical protein